MTLRARGSDPVALAVRTEEAGAETDMDGAAAQRGPLNHPLVTAEGADEVACVPYHARNLYGKSEFATFIFPALAKFGIPDILRAMDHDEKQRLARTGDVSKEAVSYRLRAAREAIRPRRSQEGDD